MTDMLDPGDPFESDWYMVRQPVPSYCYIKFYQDEKYRPVHKTKEFGPQVMWYDTDGNETGLDIAPQVLLDFDEHGTILGMELLVPGTLVYDKKREEGS